MVKPCILLTNDDGVEAPGIIGLARALLENGYAVMILAPAQNQSATSMKISIRKSMEFTKREDLEESLSKGIPASTIRVFSLAGTPSDCIIVGLSGGLAEMETGLEPNLCISGVNLGPNVSVDVLHSGTVAGAREAALYGLPAIASSSCSFDVADMGDAVEMTVDVVNRIVPLLPDRAANLLRPNLGKVRDDLSQEPTKRFLRAFLRGDLFLSVNIPKDCSGEVIGTKLGMRWYRNALHSEHEESAHFFSIDGLTVVDEPDKQCDVGVTNNGNASITALSAWPEGHPLSLPGSLLSLNLTAGEDGWPVWLS